MNNENFLTEYKENMVNKLKMLRPDLSKDKIEKVVKKKMKEKFKNPKCYLEDKETDAFNIIKFINKNKCIMTPFGALYRRHEEAPNQLAEMVNMLMSERKIAKKKKFLHEKDEDKTLYNNYEMIQLTLKLLANSFYGASIESNSIFYHPYFGTSVTSSGKNIIMTAINNFEKFIANHIMFRNIDDIYNYIYDIINEEYKHEDLEVNNKSSNDVYVYLCSKLDWPESNDRLELLLDNLSQLELNKIYYKNNLLEIIRESKGIQDILVNIVAKDDFLDPNSPPEHYKQYTDKLWDILKDWVYNDKLDFYKTENAEERNREAVLTIDTDSTFCYVQPFVDTCFEVFGIEDTKVNRMTTTNVVGWMLGKSIAANYELMTKNAGIPEPKRPIINMKNEFYYSRIMLTTNKKWYAGHILMQEGHIKKEPKLDIKGISIKKVTVPEYIRDFFLDVINNDLLASNEISLSNVVTKYHSLENTIKNSLLSGNIEFLKPDKINSIDSYAFPYRMQSVRGTLVWNEIYPDNEISIPDKVNIVKTTLNTIEDIKESNIPEDIKDKILSLLLVENENLANYGVSSIAIPKNIDKIPDWIIPYIDLNSHIVDNMQPGKVILDSLGFKTITINTNQIATNIIDI